MSASSPPVSVGLPVRNGMPYLVESLEALCCQTFADFDVLVCDNASTDGTEEAVREFARADDRIKYLRVDTDSGASANFNRCFERTDGSLFTWAASDDRYLPRYLERCVAHLNANSEHAMCIPSVLFIDEDGRVTGSLHQPEDLASPLVARRLHAYLDRRSWYMVYGVVRREALRRTNLFPARFGPDVTLIWELLLREQIGTDPEHLLEYRRYRVKRAQSVWQGIQPEGSAPAPRWPHLELYKDLLSCATDDELDIQARAAGRRALLRWLVSAPYRDLVVDDLRDELWNEARRHGTVQDMLLMCAMSILRPTRVARQVGKQVRARTGRAAASRDPEKTM